MNTELIITKIEIYKLRIPYKQPFNISLGTITHTDNIVVRIHTDAGIIGTGEGSPFAFINGEVQDAAFEIGKLLASALKGKNALAIADRWKDIDQAIAGNNTIKSAFDIALYDIMGKHCNLPLYALWGGNNDLDLHTDMTVGIASPDQMAGEAVLFVKEGFPAIKVKLGTTMSEDVARIKAIREAIGYDIPLSIDANQGWDVATAIRTLKALEKYDIKLCEEPVPAWNQAGLKQVYENSPISIMADESVFDHRDAFRLAASQSCDSFNIKLSKSGGITNALKIADIAEAAGLICQVGCMADSRFALTVLAHLCMAKRNIIHYDMDSALMLAEDPVEGGITYGAHGKIRLEDAPGVGAEFKEEYLEKMPSVVI
ncbi:dipeptide epimerase [Algivirga pacifica]|uniref:Dipeptide epimerase n=1 Tax=Algivirga pacifica TaxID=1162670 RepID=A0ABP9D2E1_9BACT